MKTRRFDIALRLVVPGTCALFMLLAALGGEPARLAGRYERAPVLGGEIWRLFTAHFVHLGWAHTVLNIAGLGLVWALFAPALRGWRGMLVLASSMLAIDVGFLLNEPRLEWYVGFSGALHGLFAAGVVATFSVREREAWLLATLFVAKLAWEQLLGPLPLTAELAGGPVVEDAHLYGACGGLLAAALLAAMRLREARL